VLGKSVTCGMANFYAILNKTGSLTGGTTNNVDASLILDAAYSDGSAYTWVPASVNYAAAPVDVSTLKPFSRYKFEAYQAGPVLKATFYAPSIAAPIPAKYGNSLTWNELSATSKEYLDPANAKAAAQTTVPLSWTQPSGAPAVEAAFVYGLDFVGGTRVLASAFGIKSTATSVTVDPTLWATGTGVSCSTQTVPALLNTSDLRQVDLRSRTHAEIRMHSNYYYLK
jgi:hypothetical protein